MASTAATPETTSPAIHPPTVALGHAWPWLVLGAALLALLYLVGLDEGALALVPGHTVHEFVHDGRHLLAFPCH